MALSWQGSSRDNRYNGLGDFKERSPYPKLVFTLPTHDGSSVEKNIKQHYQEVMKPEKIYVASIDLWPSLLGDVGTERPSTSALKVGT